jgi:hypothetical protein
MKLRNFLSLIFVVVLSSGLVANANQCHDLFSSSTENVETQLQQWLAWEISPTVKNWNQEKRSSPLPIAEVKSSTLEVEILSSVDIHGLEKYLDLNQEVLPWFQHPYNTDRNVPNQSLTPTSYGTADHTASRTIRTKLNGRNVSLKMATNYPFGPSRDRQPGKVHLDADLKYSVARSKAIQEIDKKIMPDRRIIIQKEIAAVIDKVTRNGYLFRDMTPLEDGNYYLPAHQLPYIGKSLAEKRGSTVAKYWAKHWAVVLGRYQAQLLIRYGIEVRAVNPQNFLIQLDKKMNPTGNLIWRDLAESHLIEPVAKVLGLNSYIARDKANGGWGVHQNVNIDNGNIHWRFNDATPTLSDKENASWSRVHNKSYRQEIESALGIEIPENIAIENYMKTELQNPDSILIKKILEWHKRNDKSKVGRLHILLPELAAAA